MAFAPLAAASSTIFEMVEHDGSLYTIGSGSRPVSRLDGAALTLLHSGNLAFTMRAASFGGAIWSSDESGVSYSYTPAAGWALRSFTDTGTHIHVHAGSLYVSQTFAVIVQVTPTSWTTFAAAAGFSWSTLFTLNGSLYGLTSAGAIRQVGGGNTQVAAPSHSSGFYGMRVAIHNGYVYYALNASTDASATGRILRSNGGAWEVVIPYVPGEYPAIGSAVVFGSNIYFKANNALYEHVPGTNTMELVDTATSNNNLWVFGERMFASNGVMLLEWENPVSAHENIYTNLYL